MAWWVCPECGNENECTKTTDITGMECEVCGEPLTEELLLDALRKEAIKQLLEVRSKKVNLPESSRDKISKIFDAAQQKLNATETTSAMEKIVSDTSEKIIKIQNEKPIVTLPVKEVEKKERRKPSPVPKPDLKYIERSEIINAFPKIKKRDRKYWIMGTVISVLVGILFLSETFTSLKYKNSNYVSAGSVNSAQNNSWRQEEDDSDYSDRGYSYSEEDSSNSDRGYSGSDRGYSDSDRDYSYNGSESNSSYDGEEELVENITEKEPETSRDSEISMIDPSEADLSGCSLVKIVSTDASSIISQEGHDNSPIMAFDGDETTSWQEGVDGPGIGESLAAYFDREYKVKYIFLKLGNWRDIEYYYQNCRPKTVTISLGAYSESFTFPDERKEYCISFPVNTPTFNIRIDDVYQGTEWDDTVIADIKIYGY